VLGETEDLSGRWTREGGGENTLGKESCMCRFPIIGKGGGRTGSDACAKNSRFSKRGKGMEGSPGVVIRGGNGGRKKEVRISVLEGTSQGKESQKKGAGR